MSDRTWWFRPKLYGYGAGLPIAWQGWVVLVVYAAVLLAAGLFIRGAPGAFAAVVIAATTILIIVSFLTTRGGWRWRWGEED